MQVLDNWQEEAPPQIPEEEEPLQIQEEEAVEEVEAEEEEEEPHHQGEEEQEELQHPLQTPKITMGVSKGTPPKSLGETGPKANTLFDNSAPFAW